MDQKPQEAYNPPGVGSIVPLRSQNASDISAKLVKKISQLLQSNGYLEDFMILPFSEDKLNISMKDYLDAYPSRIHSEHWIDSGKQVSAIHPETYLPFFFNHTGSKIIRLFDGEHNLKEILNEFKKEWSAVPEKELEIDLIQFLLLVDELDLIELR